MTGASDLLILLIGLALGAGAVLLARRGGHAAGPQGAGAESAPPVSGLALHEASPVPCIIVDKMGNIAGFNPAAERAFGQIAPGALMFLRFRAPELRLAFDRAVASGADTSLEMEERLPAGRWYHADIRHLRDSGAGGLIGLFFRDQSEARNLDRMRSDFVANASHELRTPLASMTGFIETLQGPARGDAAARDRFLAIMREQAGRMARLIDDLLSLSRLEMRPLAPLDRIVDLQAVADHVLDAMRQHAAGQGVEFGTDYQAGPFAVAGVRGELIQVMENLIENACKYGRSGGRIVVSLSRDGREIRFGVRDFGPGIAAEHIPRLTERFYRVDAGTSPAQKGTGLGLAIVKHIVSRHQARLAVKSEPGAGAEFTVSFPAPAAPPSARPDNPEGAPSR